MIKFCAAKIVQIEQITKFYLSYFEMQPIFDLFLKVKITIKTANYTILIVNLIKIFRKRFYFYLSHSNRMSRPWLARRAQALRAIPTLDALRRLLPTGRKNLAGGRFSTGGNCILPI